MELFQILECFLPEIFNELVLVLAKKSIQNFPLHCVEESELTFWPVVGLKLNIQKMKIMASGPITSWEIHGETVSDFIFLGSKITADGDASMKLKDAYSLEGKLWPT